jgi:hypothetical protein
VDGKPAKVVHNSDRKQTHVYWGGRGQPDGDGHNHATIQDASPDRFHFLEINGRVIVNQSFNPADKSHFQRDIEARGGWIGIFRDSLRRALRMYGIGGGRRR